MIFPADRSLLRPEDEVAVPDGRLTLNIRGATGSPLDPLALL